MKAYVGMITDLGTGAMNYTKQSFNAAYHDNTGVVEVYNFDINFDYTITEAGIRALVQTEVLSHATAMSYSMAATDIVFSIPTLPTEAPTVFVNGTKKINCYDAVKTASVAGGVGVVRFYLDANGDGTGAALFPNEIFSDSVECDVFDNTAIYRVGVPTVDASRKYIDITVKKQALSTVSILGNDVVIGLLYSAAPNGTSVRLKVKGR